LLDFTKPKEVSETRECLVIVRGEYRRPSKKLLEGNDAENETRENKGQKSARTRQNHTPKTNPQGRQ
jgi:hypothetical protein